MGSKVRVHVKPAQQANATDRPSSLFIGVGFGILRLQYCGVCVAAADWQALRLGLSKEKTVERFACREANRCGLIIYLVYHNRRSVAGFFVINT